MARLLAWGQDLFSQGDLTLGEGVLLAHGLTWDDPAPTLLLVGARREPTIMGTRSGGILRIARAYDDQIHMILAKGATPIALHNGHAHLNGRTLATTEVAKAVRSLA